MAHIRSTDRDRAAHADRAAAYLNTYRANRHADDRQHAHAHAATNAHGDTYSHAYCMADKDSDTLANGDRDAVAQRNITTASSKYTHSHADTDHTRRYTNTHRNAEPIRHGITYNDQHGYGNVNHNSNADGIVHANCYRHAEFDANGHTHVD